MTKETIRVLVKPPTEELIEVEYPRYRKHDLSGDESDACVYTCMLSPSRRVDVWKRRLYGSGSEWQFEIHLEHGLENADRAYALGEGQYQLTKDEFASVMLEAKTKLDAALAEMQLVAVVPPPTT